MISPSQSNRIDVQQWDCINSDLWTLWGRGFQEPGFGSLGTPQTPGEDFSHWHKNQWVELQLNLLLCVWKGMDRRCFLAVWIKIMERSGNLREDLGRKPWFSLPQPLQREGEKSLCMFCTPWAGWVLGTHTLLLLTSTSPTWSRHGRVVDIFVWRISFKQKEWEKKKSNR